MCVFICNNEVLIAKREQRNTLAAPFHQQLRYRRALRGWSQERLAGELQVDTKTVSRWERGKSIPQPEFRSRLCEIFAIDAQAFGLMENRVSVASLQLS